MTVLLSLSRGRPPGDPIHVAEGDSSTGGKPMESAIGGEGAGRRGGSEAGGGGRRIRQARQGVRTRRGQTLGGG